MSGQTYWKAAQITDTKHFKMKIPCRPTLFWNTVVFWWPSLLQQWIHKKGIREFPTMWSGAGVGTENGGVTLRGSSQHVGRMAGMASGSQCREQNSDTVNERRNYGFVIKRECLFNPIWKFPTRTLQKHTTHVLPKIRGYYVLLQVRVHFSIYTLTRILTPKFLGFLKLVGKIQGMGIVSEELIWLWGKKITSNNTLNVPKYNQEINAGSPFLLPTIRYPSFIYSAYRPG